MNQILENAIILINNNEDKDYGIWIDPSFCSSSDMNKLMKINYANFVYEKDNYELVNVDDNLDQMNYKKGVFIRIKNIPLNLTNEIITTIKNIVNQKDKTISEAIEEILNYFSKYKLSKELKKELIGDLAEAIFIYKSLLDKNINFINNLRVNDSNLYDFVYNNLMIEIKSSSSEKNEFIITDEQLNLIKNKIIVIVKFKLIEKQTNILDIYELISKISPLNELLLEKKSTWEQFKVQTQDIDCGDLISSNTVILDKCKLNVFDNQKLPDINIISKKACKKIEYHVDCSDSQLESIDILYNKIK